MDSITFSELYLKSLRTQPWEIKQYSQLHDCELIALVDHTNYSLVDSKDWLADWSLVPDFEDWLSYFKTNEGNLSSSTFFDLDSQKYGQLQQRRTTFDLKNGGFVRLTEQLVLRQAVSSVRIEYSSLSAGLLSNSGWTPTPRLERREWVERDLTPEEMEIHNPILKDKKKKLKKEEEEKLIRTIKEEKVYEDIAYEPPEHTLLSICLAEEMRVIFENERVADYERIAAANLDLVKPIELIFGAQADSYTHAPVTTISLPNGVILKVLPEGDLLLKAFDRHWGDELARLITRKGTIISYLSNNRRQIMLANGNTLTFDGNESWITTNNKGLRRQINLVTKEEKEIAAIPAANKIFSALSSYPISCYREDGVRITIFREGDRVSSFADGTQVLSSGDGSLCLIDNPGLPVVKIYSGEHHPNVHRQACPTLDRVAKEASAEYFEVNLGIGRLFVYNEADGKLRTIIESSKGDVVSTTSQGTAVLLPGECRWGAEQILKNKDLFSLKREAISACYEEMERTTSDMMEAISNMSKFAGKGAKKLNKKQLREEREKEEKKIQDYRNETKQKLLETLASIDEKISKNPIFINEFTEFIDQFSTSVQDRRSGIFSIDINDRSFFTKDVEGCELRVSDNGEYSVIDTVNVGLYDPVRERDL